MKARSKGMEDVGFPKPDARTGALAAGHTVELFVKPFNAQPENSLRPPPNAMTKGVLVVVFMIWLCCIA
jgi:hypothetical protein